jgi:hypothetical protein
MIRGSLTPGGSRTAFFKSNCMRGPMPVRFVAAANSGMSGCGRMRREVCPLLALATFAPSARHPRDTGALRFASAGLYEGPERAKVGAATEAVKRFGRLIKADHS